uniref:Viral A-type inclusion protein repeat containing protein, expressed n=1 Tax=Oryza sativa subsp. japonica TaxID=39947 RepID=Q2QX52_ORYSJ|nr:Viral A-type inclusion protein repeat containing protein, expressed [Oryza sativa Japonica Group]
MPSRVRDDGTQEIGVTKPSNEKLALGFKLNDSSPRHGQSSEPQSSSNVRDEDVKENLKSLNDKLAAAFLTINAKEELVRQHAKVTEEAVLGWEQAESEVAALKKLLEASAQKNGSLEVQVSHLAEKNASLEVQVSRLDEALKECVRQLHLAQEDQAEKVHDVVTKSQELESENSKLQNRITELKKQLETTKLEASNMSIDHDLQEKFQAIKKENMDLKSKLLVQSKDLKILSLERDLSNQAAETASKQHLENVKKIARLEAECRRLHHLTRKATLINDSRPLANNTCVESLTDSQSDSAERMAAVDNELRNSDSWASALVAEFDQFKNGNADEKNLVNNPVVIDLMDDFLEMERLAALPESDRTSSTFDMETDSDKAVTRNSSSKLETEELRNQVADLHAQVEKIESEKKELEMALMEARYQLDISCNALVAAKNRLVEMQMELDLANDSKHDALRDFEGLNSEKKALEFQLESKSVRVEELLQVVASLEENTDKKELESQLELLSAEAKELRLTVTSLLEKIEAERSLSVQHQAEAVAACNAKESLEEQLYSANTEVERLHVIVKELEDEVEKEKMRQEELVAELEMKMETAVEAIKESLEAQLCAANTEVERLNSIVQALENDIEKEKALHKELTAQLEVKFEEEKARSVQTVKESMEAQLCSSNTEVLKLRDIVKALENEVEKEKALHEDLSAQLEAKIEAERTFSVEAIKESFQSELQSVNSEVVELRGMVTALEHEVVKEKTFSAELQMQLEALEAIKRVLESEIESAHQDNRKLNDKVKSFEQTEKTGVFSGGLTAKEEAMQSERRAMKQQLEAAKMEVGKLTNKVSLLQGEVLQERLLSEEFEQEYHKLEARLSRDSRDAKLWRLANSNGGLKAKQEKELANAAGKLAECQKTIASLGRQLKSLTDIDNTIVEPERLEPREIREMPLDFRNSDADFAVFADELYDFDLPKVNSSCFSPLPSIQPSSPPSEMSVFAGGLSSLSSFRSKRRK